MSDKMSAAEYARQLVDCLAIWGLEKPQALAVVRIMENRLRTMPYKPLTEGQSGDVMKAIDEAIAETKQ